MNARTHSLFRYIFPALGGLFVTYLYNAVDGIFAGQGVGAAALGAVNIAVPFITLVVAAAAMFPMGGATVVAIRMGRGDEEGALRIRPFQIAPMLVKKICKRGVPEAVTQLTTPVTALCYNLMLSRLIGDLGVSTFSVLSFLYSLANAVLSGVAQGLQPLWGYCYGRRDEEEMGWYFRCGTGINALLSVLIYGALCLLAEPVVRIFSREAALVQTAAAALPLFSLSFLPKGLNLIYTAFLFSTKRTGAANAIAVSRGIVLKALAIFCIPAVFGVQWIWTAPFAAEIVTLTAAVGFSRAGKLISQSTGAGGAGQSRRTRQKRS